MANDAGPTAKRPGLFSYKKRVSSKPRVVLPDSVMQQGSDALWDMLLANLMPPVGKHSNVWARPAPKFPSAYLWDSAFISQAWKLWDPEIAFATLKPFVEFQAADGRMPHYVLLGRFTSKLSNPPFLAWAVKNIHECYSKNDWLEYFLEPLVRFARFRRKHRYNEEAGLYYWLASYESGIDNSPRFTSVDELERYEIQDLGSVDLNAEIAIQHEAILAMMDCTGNYKNEDEIRNQGQEITTKIHELLWNEQEGMFGDLYFSSGEVSAIDTIASYFPLATRGIDHAKASNAIERLKDPSKYNSLIPLPSVALDSEFFIKDMWRGPVWLNTAFIVVEGIRKSGHQETAASLAYKLCKGVFETWNNEGNFFEFYDPQRHDLLELERKKGNLYKKLTLGSKPVKNFAGWTALANTLLIEDVIGLRAEAGRWTLGPGLPADWFEAKDSVVSIELPFYDIHLVMELGSVEKIHVSFKRGEREATFEMKNGEKKNLKE